MKNSLFPCTRNLLTILFSSVFLFSCNKDELLVDAEYPESTIGIAQAAVATLGPGANGVFTITPKIEGQAYRYVLDVPGKKVKLPLSVLKSGVDLGGSVSVNVGVANDTIAKLIALGRLPATTEILPSSSYTFPSSVIVGDGSAVESFNLEVNQDFLVANIANKYAVAVTISTSKTDQVNPKLSVAVIFIEPVKILVATSNFTTAVDNSVKAVGFTNLSLNGVSYTWDYGDGSAVETTISPRHKYSASGTYPVTLTATGATGAPSVKTTNITIL